MPLRWAWTLFLEGRDQPTLFGSLSAMPLQHSGSPPHAPLGLCMQEIQQQRMAHPFWLTMCSAPAAGTP